jgi:Fibronectin type III domain
VAATGAGNDGGPAVTGLYSYQSNQVFPGYAPSAPASVTARATSKTTASVTWPFSTASSGNGGWQITNYNIVVTAGGSTVQTLNTNSGHVRTITVTGLTPGVEYTYTVVAQTGNATNSGATSSAPVVQPTH